MDFSPLWNIISQYFNNNYFLVLIFLSSLLFYTLKTSFSNQKYALFPLFAVITLLVTIFNPVFYDILFLLLGDDLSYYRFIWIVPVVPLGACLLSEIISEIGFSNNNLTNTPDLADCTKPAFSSDIYFRRVLALILSIILCASLLIERTSYLTKDNLAVPENKFNISRATLDISQFIQDDPNHVDGDVVLAPTQIMMELLAYDTTIVPALPRDEYINYKKVDSVYEPLLSLILEGPESTWHHFENVLYNCKSLNVDYIVTLTLFDLDTYMEFLNYPVYNRTGDYTLYRRRDK